LGGWGTARLRALGQAFAGKEATQPDEVKPAPSAGAFAGRLWKRHDDLAKIFVVHPNKNEHRFPPLQSVSSFRHADFICACRESDQASTTQAPQRPIASCATDRSIGLAIYRLELFFRSARGRGRSSRRRKAAPSAPRNSRAVAQGLAQNGSGRTRPHTCTLETGTKTAAVGQPLTSGG
jgi:hypothetical protein